jgi:hypothetical protein
MSSTACNAPIWNELYSEIILSSKHVDDGNFQVANERMHSVLKPLALDPRIGFDCAIGNYL